MSASPAKLFLLPAVAGVFALAGCGTYRNATAYFNTYYNASHLFDEAVAEVMKTPQPARDSNYFAPFKITPAAVTKFEKVIEKGSRVIQFHSESGYMEDAIMMIGKAYLYQNETESAAGKFRELLENFPGSDKRAEAKLWYAKALYQGKNDQEALIVAKELASPAATGEEGEVSGDILLEITMLEAQIYADRGEVAQAAEVLGGSSAIDCDSRLKAIAQFQLGTVYERTKDYARAAGAYHLVGELGASPAMAFNAKLREGVMLSLAGQPDQALELFDEIVAWPLKPEQSGLVDFEVANAYWVKGDSSAAFTLYDIIDSTYKKSDAAARSYFRRGDILEKRYGELRKARKFFESAKTEFPASPVTQEAASRFTSLDNYLKTSDRLHQDDSTLQALLNPDTAHAGEILTTRSDSSADSVAVLPETAADASSGGQEPDSDASRPPPPERRPPAQVIAADNLSMRAIRARPRHLVPDPEDPDYTPPPAEGGGEPRDSGLKASSVADAGDSLKTGGKGTAKKEPKAPVSEEELLKRIAAERYELGGIFLLDLALPDSALHYYDLVVKEHQGSPLVPKALYAMSEAYRVKGDTAAGDSLYDLILAGHPETDYADQVRKLRGLDTVAALESEDAAAYARAEETLFAGDAASALAGFKAISTGSKDTLITPKACYAVGWIYENVLIDLDSADAWYRKVISAYPSSAYAASAEPRVAVREDTSKLKQFVKIKEIQAVPKPKKQTLGLIPKQAPAGKGNALPPGGDINKPAAGADEDEYFNPGEDEEEPDSTDEDSGDEEPEEPDEDPGTSASGQVLQQGTAQIPV